MLALGEPQHQEPVVSVEVSGDEAIVRGSEQVEDGPDCAFWLVAVTRNLTLGLQCIRRTRDVKNTATLTIHPTTLMPFTRFSGFTRHYSGDDAHRNADLGHRISTRVEEHPRGFLRLPKHALAVTVGGDKSKSLRREPRLSSNVGRRRTSAIAAFPTLSRPIPKGVPLREIIPTVISKGRAVELPR
jgi:hypothetical protein